MKVKGQRPIENNQMILNIAMISSMVGFWISFYPFDFQRFSLFKKGPKVELAFVLHG
jgi:hypothetical protein